MFFVFNFPNNPDLLLPLLQIYIYNLIISSLNFNSPNPKISSVKRVWQKNLSYLCILFHIPLKGSPANRWSQFSRFQNPAILVQGRISSIKLTPNYLRIYFQIWRGKKNQLNFFDRLHFWLAKILSRVFSCHARIWKYRYGFFNWCKNSS